MTLASLSTSSAFGQDVPVAAHQAAPESVARAVTPPASPFDPIVRWTPSFAAAATDAAPAEAAVAAVDETGSGVKSFIRDVGGDYKAFFSKGVALRLGIGGAAAGIVHIWDQDIKDQADGSAPGFLDGGAIYGGPGVQYPLAIGWWAVSHLAGNGKGASAGRDLLRAQISATSWTYLSKFVTQRDRPNGDPRAFPSGHTSSTFATATVLQRYYGWKVGVPFYALGVYAGASRIAADKHWTSDVVFGAAVGVASGYTVTRRIHAHNVTLGPTAYPGGGGVSVTVSP